MAIGSFTSPFYSLSFGPNTYHPDYRRDRIGRQRLGPLARRGRPIKAHQRSHQKTREDP